jgi:hypothetical protein
MLNNSHWAIKCIDSEDIFAVVKFKSPNDFDKRVKDALQDEYGWEEIVFTKPDLEGQLLELPYPTTFRFSLTNEESEDPITMEMYPTWEY